MFFSDMGSETDIILVCIDGEVAANKDRLLEESKILAEMIQSSSSASGKQKIRVNYKVDTIKNFIRFLETKDIELPSKEIIVS